MVENFKTIVKILKVIECYYILKNQFKLDGSNFSLVLLVPSESYGPTKYSWILSGKLIDSEPETKVVNEIFKTIKESTTLKEYSTISRINILDTNHPLVKNINFTVPKTSVDIVQINGLSVGNFNLHNCILIRSSVLSYLIKDRAVTMTLNNNRIVNAGVISIDNEFIVKHYTGKGLRTLFNQEDFDRAKVIELKAKGEDFLVENNYIGFTDLKDIRDIF